MMWHMENSASAQIKENTHSTIGGTRICAPERVTQMAHREEGPAGMWEMLLADEAPVDVGSPPESVDIGQLPDEVLIKIFSYLSLRDLAWCSHTCRRWHNILKEKTSLWKFRDCSTFGMGNIEEVLAVAGAVPQLWMLYLMYSRDFRIDISWPEATVYHHYGDAPLTWKPYFEAFDTECLVLDHSMQKNVFFYLSWVDCQNLKKIVVLEQPQFQNHQFVNWVSTTCTLEEESHPSQSESYPSKSAEPPLQFQFQYDKWPKTESRDRLPDGTSEEENIVCPLLEEVNVYCKFIWDQHLENLCSLGPLRVLHIECQRLHSLTFLRCCSLSLEVLIVTDCRYLLEDAFAELCCLKRLRVLHLSNCRVEESTIRNYADDLPHLRSFFFNGHEAN